MTKKELIKNSTVKNSIRFLIPGIFLLILGIGNLYVGIFKYEQYNEIVNEYESEIKPLYNQENLSPLQRLKSTIDYSTRSLEHVRKAKARRDFYQLVQYGGRVFLAISVLYFFAYGLSRFL